MSFDTKKSWDACGAAFDRYTTTDDSFSDNIERPALAALMGDITGARALDLGCGSGTHSTWMAEGGAQVVGVDLSSTMLALAHERARNHGVDLELCLADISTALPFAAATFDLVLTATALHYVADLATTMREIARVLKPGGLLIASLLHPMSTARFPIRNAEQPAAPDGWATRQTWGSHYFGAPTREVETPWLGCGDISSEGRRIGCYHHTIDQYFHAMRAAGLVVTDLREPQPDAEFANKSAARFEEAMSLPIYLMFKAER
jgi:ubiquinone/menaquinone biosynthesis C-methylase UbiE